MKNNFNITINNTSIGVSNNSTIMQVCNINNINIPKFCYHNELSIAGNCRMCLVEVKGVNKPVASCAISITDNMVIFTNSRLVKKAREGILEFILINHPLDCPICDQGGECDLQDQSLVFGSDRGRFYEYKRSVKDKDCGLFIKAIMTRCIHCTRCVRFLNEVSGFKYLGLIGRGNKIEISNYINKVIFSELSGNIVDLCPVGALTLKTYAFKARPWELNYFSSLDLLDPFNVNIRIDVRDLKILRILPIYNNILKENWITDITRYSFDGLHNFRLLNPLYKNKKSKLISLSWLETYKLISNLLLTKNLNFILGDFIDIETALILKKIKSLFNNNLTINNQHNIDTTNVDFRNNYFVNNLNIQNILSYDNIILVNCNLRLYNPLLNLKIKNFAKIKNHVFSIGSSYYSNFFIYNYGINLKELYVFFKGQSELDLIFKKKKNLMLINDLLLQNNSSINWFLLMKSFKKYLFVDVFMFNNYNSHISSIKELNLNNNIYKFNDYSFKKSNNKYLQDNEIYYFLNTNKQYIKDNLNFSIYQGSNNNNYNDNNNLFLPSVNYLEKNASYVNFLGYYQKTKFILYPPKNSRSDWKILYILFNSFFKKKITFNFLNSIIYEYNLCYNDYYFDISNLAKKVYFKNHFKIKNSFLNNTYYNVYNSNAIISSSKNILNIFKKIKAFNSNFY